jgi:hypothetical protein
MEAKLKFNNGKFFLFIPEAPLPELPFACYPWDITKDRLSLPNCLDVISNGEITRAARIHAFGNENKFPDEEERYYNRQRCNRYDSFIEGCGFQFTKLLEEGLFKPDVSEWDVQLLLNPSDCKDGGMFKRIGNCVVMTHKLV